MNLVRTTGRGYEGEKDISTPENLKNLARKAWPVLLPALLVLLVYLPTVQFDFAWDDDIFLQDLPVYRGSEQWLPILFQPFVLSPNYFRPLALLTFGLELRLGSLNPAIFHLTNLLLHTLNTALVALLARKMWGRSTPDHDEEGRAASPSSWQMPVFAGLLYGLHPALIEGVAFISSRFDLLMTAFLLLALLGEVRLKGRPRLAAVGAAFLLAALSKEMALAFALALPFWRLARTAGEEMTGEPLERRERLSHLAKRLDLPLHAAVLAGGLAYLGMRYTSLGYLILPSDAAIAAGNALQRALLAIKSLGGYLRVLIWPFGSLAPIHYSPLPVPAGETAAWGMLLMLGLLVYGLALLLRSRRVSARRAGWLALAGTASLLPVVNLLPLELGGGAFIAERFLLFPAGLFVLALTAGLQPVLEGEVEASEGQTDPATKSDLAPATTARNQRLAYAALGAWLVACLVTVQLTLPHWRDDLSLWSWAWGKEPRSSTPPSNLSLEYTDMGQPQRGLELAQQALQLEPESPNTWNNVGLALFHLGNYAEAQSAFERAVELQPESALYWSNLAGALREQEQLQQAEKILLDQALRLQPDLPAAHLNLGMVYLLADRPDLAAQQLQIAVQLLPPDQGQEAQNLLQQTQDPNRWLRLGGLLLENGEPQGAAQAFDNASRLGASLTEAAYGLSTALIQMEDWQNARSVLEAALQQMQDARLYNNLGIVLQGQGELELARQMFAKAVELAPEWEEPQMHLLELDKE